MLCKKQHTKSGCQCLHIETYATSLSRIENILGSRQIQHTSEEEDPPFCRQRGKERKQKKIFIQQCKNNITQGNIEQDIPNDQEEIFVPNKRARHRVPKTFSSANPTQKTQSQPNVQKTTNNNTSKQNAKKNTDQATKKKSVQNPKQQNANSEEEDSNIEHGKEQAKLNANPLEIFLSMVTLQNALGVTVNTRRMKGGDHTTLSLRYTCTA